MTNATKKFSAIRRVHDPDIEKEAALDFEAEVTSYVASLADVRRARQVTQTELAARLAITQASVSRMEASTDPQLSTLKRYIEGLGGECLIVAAFPNGEDVTILLERS